MNKYHDNQKNIMQTPQAKVVADTSAWFQQVAILSFAALVLAVTVIAASMAWAADDVAVAAPSEASGHDMYRRGLYAEAIVEWTKAADEENDPGAAFRLGEEYFDAKIVERDVPTALKYFMIGAEGGDDRAQQDLATLYDNGWGVEASIDEAAKWYLAAALQGSPVAQYNIGTMYHSGAGVEQNVETAYMYFLLAVEGGFPHFATNELASVSKEMTAQQIKDATVMARQFTPTGNGADEEEG